MLQLYVIILTQMKGSSLNLPQKHMGIYVGSSVQSNCLVTNPLCQQLFKYGGQIMFLNKKKYTSLQNPDLH